MKPRTFLLFATALTFILVLANLAWGSVKIPLDAVIDICLGKDVEKSSWSFIVLQSRLPQAVTALLAGASLATAGLMLQTAFNNPLAGPSILGVNSGAGLGVARRHASSRRKYRRGRILSIRDIGRTRRRYGRSPCRTGNDHRICFGCEKQHYAAHHRYYGGIYHIFGHIVAQFFCDSRRGILLYHLGIGRLLGSIYDTNAVFLCGDTRRSHRGFVAHKTT